MITVPFDLSLADDVAIVTMLALWLATAVTLLGRAQLAPARRPVRVARRRPFREARA